QTPAGHATKPIVETCRALDEAAKGRDWGRKHAPHTMTVAAPALARADCPSRAPIAGTYRMVMPLADHDTGRTTSPVVNYALIAANVLVFVLLQGLDENVRFTYAFATVPREIVTGRDVVTDDREVRHPVTGQVLTVPGLQPTPVSVYLTLWTSMFM